MKKYVYSAVGAKKNRKAFYKAGAAMLLTLMIGVLFFLLNYYTPIFADDYSYTFSFLSGKRITSPFEIIESQIGHYQNVNGRSITHALAQLFLLMGDEIFNLVNTVFFVALIYLIYFHAVGSFVDFSLLRLSMIAMLLFLSCPAFGQSFLWITGAANYLYGVFIILSFLSSYRLQLRNKTCSGSFIHESMMAIAWFPLGIVAGWTNENTSIALISMIVAFLIVYKIRSIRIRVWNITGCLGSIVGCILMLCSPGTSGRLEAAGGSGNLIAWIKRFVFYTCDLCINMKFLVLLFAVLVVTYLREKNIKNYKWNEQLSRFLECDVTVIYLLGFLASVYSMIVSPEFPGRAWSGPVVFCLITVMSLASLVDLVEARIEKIVTIIFVLMLFCSTYINAYFELKNVDASYDQRVQIIETAISSGNTCVEIPNIYGYTGYSCYSPQGDLDKDSKKWPNTAIAKYYDIEEIICGD